MNSVNRSRELRIVTILFADIAGFTRLTEEREPEEVTEILEDCFSHIDKVVVENGGIIDKHEGDRVMAIFGLPVARKTDIKRALRAALQLINKIDKFSKERGLDIGLHIGISAGRVLCGEIGSPYKKEYTVIGDPVNVAARLTDKTPKNKIYVSEEIYNASFEEFDFREVEKITFYGKTKPVKVYELLEEKSIPKKFFVDREQELSRMRLALKNLISGRSQIITIIGEPGIGKSTLVEEFFKKVKKEVLTITGEVRAFDNIQTFSPIIDFLHAVIGENTEKIKKILKKDWKDVLPYILLFKGEEIPKEMQTKIRYLSPESKKLKIFLSLSKIFEELSKTKPVLFFIRDFHDADSGTVDFISFLLKDIERMRVMLLFELRKETDKMIGRFLSELRNKYKDILTEIELTPLSLEYSFELIKKRAPEIEKNLAQKIIEKSKGNPLFIEEMTKAGLTEFPVSLQSVIMARIDRLEKNTREILEIASLIGEQFDSRILERIVGSSERVKRCLNFAEYTEFIQQISEIEYRFKHDLVKEVLERRILKKRKMELHREIAEAMREVYAYEIENHYEKLAYHYAESGDYRRAADYLELAGDKLAGIDQSTTAITYYEKALKLMEGKKCEKRG